MSIKLQLPKVMDLRPRITVVGIGGAGGNAINNMISSGLTGVEFVVANTDAQALAASSCESRIQLGVHLTEGLGAGSKPEIGQAAAEEAVEDIRSRIAGSHMVFIAAGMGGGTGTGAAAVIARAARDLGILTVGVVTKPFQFEGARRMRSAEAGIGELRKYVDTLIVIPNQNLFRIASERTTFAEAFVLADQVLYSGIACIVDLIVKEGLINLDFADVRTVMSGMGSAMMGTGEASGERRAILAAEEAISNPLLDEISLKGAKGLLLSIIGGRDMTLYEVDEAASRVRQEVDPEANIIVGATFDDHLGDRIRVAIVASGMHGNAQVAQPQASAPPQATGQPTSVFQRIQPQQPAKAQPVQPAQMSAQPAPQTAQPQAPAAYAAGHTSAVRMQAPAFEPQAEPRHAEPPVQPHVPMAAASSYAAQVAAPAPMQQAPPQSGPPPLPQSVAQPAVQGRELWRAPGDVVIEEIGPDVLAHQPQHPPRAPQPPVETTRVADGFRPGPPEDVRGGRRMPDVSDFPAVGQREFRAKAEQYQDTSPQQQPQPTPRVYADRQDAQPKRGGLFQRLVGGQGRNAAGADQPASRQGAPGRDQKSTGTGPDLPFFYSKDKA